MNENYRDVKVSLMLLGFIRDVGLHPFLFNSMNSNILFKGDIHVQNLKTFGT